MQQFIVFLGQIGIDVNLLMAQLVNFALLLWILNKFVYKSIIKRIEEDENQLQKAKILQDSLTTEKNDFLKQKTTELAKIKKQTRTKITEAGEYAEEIKKQAKIAAQKETDRMLVQMKKQLSSRQSNLKNEQLQNMKKQILKNLLTAAKKVSGSSDSIIEQLQDSFLSDIAQRINDFPEATFKKTNPEVILETAHPLSKSQKDNVQEIFSKKFKRPIEISTKTNADLIGGYRLEISGIAIENNIHNELINATETVQ